MKLLIKIMIFIDESYTVELGPKSELKPDDGEFERSHDPEKSDFHTEQIDSLITSNNMDNIDRESEEWEELSNKLFQAKNNLSPEADEIIKKKIKSKYNSAWNLKIIDSFEYLISN